MEELTKNFSSDSNELDTSICAVCGKPFHRIAKHQITCSRACSLARNLERVEKHRERKIKEKHLKIDKYYNKNNIITKFVFESIRARNDNVRDPYLLNSKKVKYAIDYQLTNEETEIEV